ncbi:MAG TPA: hypothetical protein P5175_10135 [Anaerohalosphaeraceae bacterium]|nr:hypothetical protein [Anaerohalosphaeraceae bacterium]HPC64886.1 hypothetical protein [Anaerohalosphaeraceae bacterium]HPO69366.1 hypothetical protein [Anaerohalosphaeraceae bacterium]HRS72194.1 hypothetical protein [Anaerohalosphaeraceae bacterium]HRV18986.1 hypothetical protein [Anaerohalosphaeraceae bacterium]
MEWLYPIALRVIAAIALIYFGLGLFNIHWLLRLRILASLSIGALIVGALGWPLVRPEDPLGAVSLFSMQMTPVQCLILVGLGLTAGAAAAFVCYPLGGNLAPYAAPAGIAVLALNSGAMRQILLTNSALQQRNAMYAFMRWELLFWLGICAAGYLGMLLALKMLAVKFRNPFSFNTTINWRNWFLAVAAGAVITYLTIGIFAQDINQFDEVLGSVAGQPGHRQAAFGVFVAVGLAAFIARYFLGTDYIPVILGASLLYIGAFTRIIDSQDLQHLVKTWPIDFYTHTIYAILPIQYAPFSVLGAMTGYWISIQFKHNSSISHTSDKSTLPTD